jgi:hypothetical protein
MAVEKGDSSYRWRGLEPDEHYARAATPMAESWWDRTIANAGQWLLYVGGALFAGEHVVNFFRAYGELRDLSYRDSEARYGIIAMMFVFAAMAVTTITALRGYLAPNIAMLTFVVARLLVQFAADDISLGNLIEFVVLLIVFGALTQRAVNTGDARDLRIADLSGAVRRLQGELDALKRNQMRE